MEKPSPIKEWYIYHICILSVSFLGVGTAMEAARSVAVAIYSMELHKSL